MDNPQGTPPPDESTLSTGELEKVLRDFTGVTGARAGDQIGPYRLLGLLGEGGFGEVWLAERREPFVQRVALKVIKPGMDSKAVIARFEQERQALAVMDHPNVAKVLDGGVTPPHMGSRPYFVMEHVQGEPITTYCDRQRLTIRQRLELFIPVCEAVQHAHHKGIIHRDIKPSNVLVSVKDDQAIPKVIDFGVAKAINQTLTDKTIFTEQGQLIGTPEYMSPEQAEMGATDIDTRTDVYSLGVLVYELISGTLPFEPKELRATGFAEIQRLIREVDPPRPSTKLSRARPDAANAISRARQNEPDRMARELRRELEWIPLRAMRKDRRERYATPLDLAQDLGRYLGGEALEAGPASALYRLRKLVTSHKGVTAALSGVAAVFLVTVGTLLYSQSRQMNEANAAALALAWTHGEIARQTEDFVRFGREWPDSYDQAINHPLVRRAIDIWRELIPAVSFSEHVVARGGWDAEFEKTKSWFRSVSNASDDQILLILLGGAEPLPDKSWKIQQHRLANLDEADASTVLRGWDATEWQLRAPLLEDGVRWTLSTYIDKSRPTLWFGDGIDYNIVYPSSAARSLLDSLGGPARAGDYEHRLANSATLAASARAQASLERIIFPAEEIRSITVYRRSIFASGVGALLVSLALITRSRTVSIFAMLLIGYAAASSTYWGILHLRYPPAGVIFFALPLVAVLAPSLLSLALTGAIRRWPARALGTGFVVGIMVSVAVAMRVLSFVVPRALL
jgi:serine/threonine protein kinase